MAISILLGLLFITITSLRLLHSSRRHQDTTPRHTVLPPSPPKLPLLGHLHLIGSLPHRSLSLLSQKHGPLMHLQLGHKPTIIVSSPSMAREVLKTQDLDFCSRPQLVAPNKYTYGCKDISFSPYGDYWREMRKTCIVQLFSLKRIKSFCPLMDEEVAATMASMSLSSSKSINLTDLMTSLVNRIVCRVALGKGGSDQSIRVHVLLEEIQSIVGAFYVGDYFPSLGWVDRITGRLGRLEKSAGKLDLFYEQVIEEHLDPKRARGEHDQDMVDVLLGLQKEAVNDTRDHMKAIITDIFTAGTETASATIIWAMSELIKNSELMKKVQEEVRASVGIKGNVEEGDLILLPLLRSVVKETLRLHSPVPLLLPREAMRQCKIGGYDILPKTRVFVNCWAIGRDPKTWKEPEKFLPERFMDSSVDFKGHDFEYIPFGSGRRICPAMNLGILTIELALANLLYTYDWKLPTGMKSEDIDMSEEPGLVMHKKGALHLVPTKHDVD